MATITRGGTDQTVDVIKKALEDLEQQYPGASAFLYRQNSASVRIRVIDQRFQRMSKGDRHDLVWDFLAGKLPEDTLQDISVLLLLAPAEVNSSFMNSEFNDPVPSGL